MAAGSTHGAARPQKPGVPSVLVPDRLFFVLVSDMPRDSAGAHYFQIDDQLTYEPFFSDFGPLNAAHVKRFVDLVDGKLAAPALQGKQLFLCSNYHDRERATNAACVAALYMVLRCDASPDAAAAAISNWQQCLLPFRDASPYPPTFDLWLSDVVHGVWKAHSLGWFPLETFDVAAYEYYEQLANGDWNWIVPGRFLAFSGPNGPHTTFTVEEYLRLFRQLGVNCVVRLNKKTYDREHFVRSGFRHVDLFFSDGSAPPPVVVRQFLQLAADDGLCIAIHCKAGLGRTGTLIAAWMMRYHGFTAREAIGWIRIMRPGSVIGPQQLFLAEAEQELHSAWAGLPPAAEAPRQTLPAHLPQQQQQQQPPAGAAPCAAPAADGGLHSDPACAPAAPGGAQSRPQPTGIAAQRPQPAAGSSRRWEQSAEGPEQHLQREPLAEANGRLQREPFAAANGRPPQREPFAEANGRAARGELPLKGTNPFTHRPTGAPPAALQPPVQLWAASRPAADAAPPPQGSSVGPAPVPCRSEWVAGAQSPPSPQPRRPVAPPCAPWWGTQQLMQQSQQQQRKGDTSSWWAGASQQQPPRLPRPTTRGAGRPLANSRGLSPRVSQPGRRHGSASVRVVGSRSRSCGAPVRRTMHG